ncbi:hypothetical protein [Comamonas guangdongensis]|uniref:N-acetyltransferase domain-containing protein n=1 Tax=Comamonas guangdongensis TaxID=510515 RepID=A0ABV3ZWG0_9BURK
MTLPAFNDAWREKQRIKPHICILEVRDRNAPDGKPIARLFVQREERYKRDDEGKIYEASISLSYETIEPKYSLRHRTSGSFDASYSRGFYEGNGSVSLVDGALFFDPPELCGQRIGTYLMNEIVTWAQQWPEATVRPIKLLSGQAYDENRTRRNRFYERFGLVFRYQDSEQREGVSKPMPVKSLTPVTSWEANIGEHDPREYLAELLHERELMMMDASQHAMVIQNLTVKLEEARNHPVRWAARHLWWRLAQPLLKGALLLVALGALTWVSFQSK